MSSDTGKWIIIAGIIIMVFGVLIYFFHNNLLWFGNLPGDIRIERKNFRFYFPVTTLIIISLIINALFRIFKWLK